MFKECDTCNAKLGSPVLCSGCLQNRAYIHVLEMKLNEISGMVIELQKKLEERK
jgi:hypothetical protein